MPKEKIHGVTEWRMAVLRTGSVLVELHYAATPEQYLAGRTKLLRLAMSVEQARAFADDLRQTAGLSGQSGDAGNA